MSVTSALYRSEPGIFLRSPSRTPMAPRSRILIGAAFFLTAAIPIVLRYDINREHAIWLIPLGACGDSSPIFTTSRPSSWNRCMRSTNAPWADLFGFHYTLDRSAVRARYGESVFGSISVFLLELPGSGLQAEFGVRRLCSTTAGARIRSGTCSWACRRARNACTLGHDDRTGWLPACSRTSRKFQRTRGRTADDSRWRDTRRVLCGDSGSHAARANAHRSCVDHARWSLDRDRCMVGHRSSTLAVMTGAGVPLLHLGSLAAPIVYGALFGSVYGESREKASRFSAGMNPTLPFTLTGRWHSGIFHATPIQAFK